MSRTPHQLKSILGPRGRYVLTWVVALGITVGVAIRARHAFDGRYMDKPADQHRADGNLGHALIDFGGQWLMSRMVVTGHGRELYHRDLQREILTAAYPRADEGPGQEESDAERLLGWLVTAPPYSLDEPKIGGALYPPIQAVLFAPLGLLEPRPAYRLTQCVGLVLTWIAGAACAGIGRGRLSWPLATTVLMIFPGYAGALDLGQNSIVSLMILFCGWWLLTRGHEIAAGVVWGFLAFKPTWAAAFFLMPLLIGRWRMAIAMAATGMALALATLPVVGIEPWSHWLRIGRHAAAAYDVDDNWIFLGRDLLGIPRRWLLDFDLPREVRDRPIAGVIGIGLWIAIVGTTVAVSWLRRGLRARYVGEYVTFVGLGSWLSCFHFIYYDVLLAAFPVGLLLSDPRHYSRPVRLNVSGRDPDKPRPLVLLNSFVLNCLALLVLYEQVVMHLKIDIAITAATAWGLRPIQFSTRQAGTPWDTFVLMALWAYCGVNALFRSEPRP
jgi:arabinofuranan 3-O-arabinosyltransferase